MRNLELNKDRTLDHLIHNHVLTQETRNRVFSHKNRKILPDKYDKVWDIINTAVKKTWVNILCLPNLDPNQGAHYKIQSLPYNLNGRRY